MAIDAYHIHKHRTSYTKLSDSAGAPPAQVPLMKTPYVNTAEVEPSAFEQEHAYGDHESTSYPQQDQQRPEPAYSSQYGYHEQSPYPPAPTAQYYGRY